MTISKRLNDAFTLAVGALLPEQSRLEAEALEELAQGSSPLTFDATLDLLQRWIDLPLDMKPAVEYERFLGDCRLRVSDFTGFLFWLFRFTGGQFDVELVRRQPALAAVFRSQFLEITATDYKRWSGVRGTCYPYAQFLASQTLEFVDHVLGEDCQHELISCRTVR